MHRGISNLSLTDDLRTDVIMFEGEAEFYWHQLLTPNEIDSLKPQPEYIPIPKSWHKCANNLGEPYPAEGYATYRMGIVVQRNLSPTTYMIKIPTVFSSYRLWVGHLLMAEVGTVGTSREDCQPGFRDVTVSFTLGGSPKPTSDTIYMVMQVANYHHIRAGLHEAITFAEQSNMLLKQTRLSHFTSLALGLALLTFIIFALQSSLYIQNRSMIWLAVVAMGMALRIFSTGDRLIASMIPGLPWEVLFKFDNISGFSTIPLFSLFFRARFTQEHGRRANQLLCGVGILIALLVAILPQRIYGQYKTIYEVYVGIGALYLLFWVVLRAIIRRRLYAIPTFLSLGVIVYTAFYDVLGSMGIVQVRNLTTWGIMAFIIIEVGVTTINNIRVQKKADSMSGKLQQQASELELKVEERVAELKQQQEVLLSHQEREAEVNWRNVGLAKVNEVIVKYKDNYRDLCQQTLSTLVGYVDAKIGDIYLVHENANGESELEMVASYGVSKEQQEENQFIPTNHGLVGASFTRNQTQVVTDLPKGYAAISSGLGVASPDALLLQPMEFDGRVLGVIELGMFGEVPEKTQLLLQASAGVIAANLNSTIMSEQNVRLIKQFEAKAQEMRENEARMRSTIEDLDVIREQYERLRAEMDGETMSAYGD